MEGEDVRVWFPIKKGFFRNVVGHVKAVDGIDVTVRAGQTLGVVGESGSGKTTLGLALARLISSERAHQLQRPRHQQAVASTQMRPLRRELQIVFQDPFGSLSPRMSVSEIIEEGLKIHAPSLSVAERDRMVVTALNEVGLDPATRFRYPHEFSGGQRQRIAIARAMVLKPRFVMLDEPTSALDMSVQAQVVDLLRDLQAKNNLAYLFISHDLKVVRALANDVIVMRNGKIVEYGPSEQIFRRPAERLYQGADLGRLQDRDRARRRGQPVAEDERRRMSGMDKGRILLSVTGFNPQRWYELLSASRTVTLEPDGPADPTITYAVVWKHRPNLLVDAAQPQGDLFDRRRRRPYLRRPRPAEGAGRQGRRRQSDPVHDGVCRLARARPSSPGRALPRRSRRARSGTSRRSGRPATSRSASWGSAISAAPRRRR